jgi:hypothetical protein
MTGITGSWGKRPGGAFPWAAWHLPGGSMVGRIGDDDGGWRRMKLRTQAFVRRLQQKGPGAMPGPFFLSSGSGA